MRNLFFLFFLFFSPQTLTSLQSLEALGINTNLSKISIITKNKVTRALNTSLSIDNHLLSQEGLEQIGDDFKNMGRNFTQVARGLKNNILTQSIVNTLRDEESDLITEMQRYIALDSLITSISNNEELLLALNGLTNLNSEEMLGVLGEVAHSASGKDGFDAPLSLYNNEENTKGYAYSGAGSKNGGQWNKERNKRSQRDKRDKGNHQRDSKQE